MTDEEMLACATAFTLIHNRHEFMAIRDLKVELRRRDPDGWAIVGDNNVLNHDGEWEYEPLPSSRTDDFFVRCRWPTAREALAFAEEHLRNYPSGYKSD